MNKARRTSLRRLLDALGALAGVFLFLVSQSLFACGDKLVLLGRGIRFQRMIATKHPAAILVYLNPGTGISAADREYQLRSLLKLAGHRPRSVTSAAELAMELGSGKYDLVLADYSDAPALEKEVQADGVQVESLETRGVVQESVLRLDPDGAETARDVLAAVSG